MAIPCSSSPASDSPPNLPFGETDGPPGAAVLARALAKGFGAQVVLVTEQAHLAPVAATGRLLGNTLDGVGSIAVESFPLGIDAGRAAAAGLIAKHRPEAVIFIERPGPNAEGYFHGIRGDCGSPEGVGHLYLLADAARAQGVLTIGIGDGGNEVGFGAVRQEIAESLPSAGRCLNGCPSGVVTTITTDIIVSASVSNWGAYAVAAALAVLRRESALLHTPELERELIAASVAAGARDGATFAADLLVDGIDCNGPHVLRRTSPQHRFDFCCAPKVPTRAIKTTATAHGAPHLMVRNYYANVWDAQLVTCRVDLVLMRLNDFAQELRLLDNVLFEGCVVNDVHRARIADE